MKSWYCLDCGKVSVTEKEQPRFCAFCGTENIVGDDRLTETPFYTEKKKEFENVKAALNKEYEKIKPLNRKYIEMTMFFRSLKTKNVISVQEFVALTEGVKCKQFKQKLTEQ